MQVDLEHAKQLCSRFDKEKEITHPFSNSTFENLPLEEQLDKMIMYLRRVHIFCFYCAEDYDTEYDMHRKCAFRHVRPRKESEEEGAVDQKAEKWVGYFEHKIKDWLEEKPSYEVLTGRTELTNVKKNRKSLKFSISLNKIFF